MCLDNRFLLGDELTHWVSAHKWSERHLDVAQTMSMMLDFVHHQSGEQDAAFHVIWH
jgi:hypothetical protein